MQATMEQGTSIEIISFALAESLFIFLSPTLKKKQSRIAWLPSNLLKTELDRWCTVYMQYASIDQLHLYIYIARYHIV